jgi:hypothetical protein
MKVGNAEHLFGADADIIGTGGLPKTTSVKGHPRTRVIGGATKTISAYTYTYDQWPASGHGQAAGGTPVSMAWEGSEGSWISRVSGPLWSLASFLEDNATRNCFFTALGGKTYGPFRKGN